MTMRIACPPLRPPLHPALRPALRARLCPLICTVLCALALLGCGAPTQSFDISVKNHADFPVMLWLTKDGPPAEKGWLTTEQFLAAPQGERSPGVALPPGKTAETGKVSGKFPQGTNAVLLVFRTGQPAGEPRAPGVTVLLRPGKNTFAVAADEAGGLSVTDTTTGAPATLLSEP